MKLCMIGCGGHASEAHGPAQLACRARYSELELTACCDLDARRAASYCGQFGFKRHYCDVAQMIAAERPDAVCVVVPTHLMVQVAKPLLERGIALLMEKPPGLTRMELDQLSAAAGRGRALHMVAFNRRFMPVMAHARSLLDATLPPDQVHSIDCALLRCARTEPDFSTTAIHAFDAAQFLARSPYRQIRFRYRDLPALGPAVVEVSVDAEFACGTHAHLRILPVCGADAETMALHGIGHSLFVDIKQMSYSHWVQGRQQVRERGAPDLLLHGRGFLEQLCAFVEACLHHRPATPCLSDVRQSVDMMEAMRNRRQALDY